MNTTNADENATTAEELHNLKQKRVAALLQQRQDDCDRLLKEKLSEQIFDNFRKAHGGDLLKYETIFPVVLGRECWETWWSVFRDTVEFEARRTLDEFERAKKERDARGGPGLFR